MATSTIRGIRILKEPAFGCPNADTLEPDFSLFNGTDDVELDVDRASLTPSGDPVINARDETRGGFYREPGDPETILGHADGAFPGVPYPVRRGTMSLAFTLEGYGSADPDDAPTTWILDAGLGIGWQPANAAEIVQSNAGAQIFDVDDGAQWRVGGLISTTLEGSCAEYSAIVGISDAEVSHSPAFSAEADAGPSTVRPMRTWVSSVGNALLGSSLAFKIDGDGWRTYAFGCRPQSYQIQADNRRVRVTVEINCAAIVDDHDTVDDLNGAQISSPPYRTGGPVMHALGTKGLVLSNAIDVDDAAYPRIPGRVTPAVNSWGVTITNTLEPVGAGMSCSVIGMTDMEVVDRAVEVTVSIDPVLALDADVWSRKKRNVVLGFGPGGAAGSGGCVYLPAGHITNDAGKRNLGGPRVVTDLTIYEGGWHGDAGTATAASNTAFRLGLVV